LLNGKREELIVEILGMELVEALNGGDGFREPAKPDERDRLGTESRGIIGNTRSSVSAPSRVSLLNPC